MNTHKELDQSIRLFLKLKYTTFTEQYGVISTKKPRRWLLGKIQYNSETCSLYSETYVNGWYDQVLLWFTFDGVIKQISIYNLDNNKKAKIYFFEKLSNSLIKKQEILDFLLTL